MRVGEEDKQMQLLLNDMIAARIAKEDIEKDFLP
jgi:hypothetical protein